MKMKILYIAVLVMSISKVSIAQKRPKLEDALPNILQQGPQTAVAQLKKYLSEDSIKNVAPYLQLGLIYHQRFIESDPLREYGRAIANIELSDLAFEEVIKHFDERSAARKSGQFINFLVIDERGKAVVSFDSIQNTIERSRAIQQRFMNNVPKIVDAFGKSYSAYSSAVNQFTDIIGDYKTVKELYLLYDDQLAERFEKLKSTYLDAIKWFGEYQSRKDTFDIGYSQKLNIQTIDIYRLDGLSAEINFLANDIEVWNYGQWVDDTHDYVNEKIKELREQMVHNEKLIKSKLDRVEQDFSSGQYEQLTVDKQFINNLRKYDLGSVIEPLFQFKEYKHALLHQEHWAKAIQTNTGLDYDQKMSSYGRMLYTTKQAQDLLDKIVERNTESSYSKYQDFLDRYYQGIDGVKVYINQEKSQCRSDFKKYFGTITELARAKFEQGDQGEELSYGKYNIPNYIMQDESNKNNPDQLHTLYQVTNIDDSEYLAGNFYNSKTEKVTAYVCKKQPNGKVTWLQEISLKTNESDQLLDTRLTAFTDTQSGCTVVVNTASDEGGRKNYIIRYDEQGNEVANIELRNSNYPRSINYIQDTQSYIITFKGEDEEYKLNDTSSLYISHVNSNGEVVWETVVPVVGNVTGLAGVEDGFVVSGNYISIINLNKEKVISESGESTFVLKLNNDGKLKKELFLQKRTPYYTDILFKSGDHAINIIGSKTEHKRGFQIENDNAVIVHFIVTKDLEIVADSFD
ncbi:hypothetical protein [Reichenbachiella versicolor]|uniref:hypothetical protein n=1 Tax=Reichenbachiella versicolor TaxID=1821036 RepID=UPI000D6E9EE9|nr:hypothetical protein [Reichenbachiella versicolor]